MPPSLRELFTHGETIYSIIESGRLPAWGFPVRIHRDDLAKVVERCRIKPGELRHLNQYAGRPVTDVAKWYRSKADKVHDTSVSAPQSETPSASV